VAGERVLRGWPVPGRPCGGRWPAQAARPRPPRPV